MNSFLSFLLTYLFFAILAVEAEAGTTSASEKELFQTKEEVITSKD